jgi:hypothetical protein
MIGIATVKSNTAPSMNIPLIIEMIPIATRQKAGFQADRAVRPQGQEAMQ